MGRVNFCLHEWQKNLGGNGSLLLRMSFKRSTPSTWVGIAILLSSLTCKVTPRPHYGDLRELARKEGVVHPKCHVDSGLSYGKSSTILLSCNVSYGDRGTHIKGCNSATRVLIDYLYPFTPFLSRWNSCSLPKVVSWVEWVTQLLVCLH